MKKKTLRFFCHLGAKVRFHGSPGAARAQTYNFNKLVGAQVTGWKGNEIEHTQHSSLRVKFQPVGTKVFDFTEVISVH